MQTSGRRRPTIRDVAQRAGVSKGAVSFALNGRPGVADETRARILRAAEELGWRPNASARALSQRRALAIGLVLARTPAQIGNDPYFGQLLAGMEGVLAVRGYALVMSVVGDAATEVETYERLISDRRIDGVVLTDPRADDPRYPLLSALEIPAVVVGDPVWDCPFPYVAGDERPVVLAAVQHLIALGHRRIGNVSGPLAVAHAAVRERAWRDAMAGAGLECCDSVDGGFSTEGATRATQRLLDAAQPPTAVVYASDIMAIAGIGVARERGLRVPGDVSIVGYDDIALARHIDPPLTTVRQDPVAAGRVTASRLLATLDGTAPDPATVPEPTLVVRSSTAAPPAG
ncbi:MAG TPA: LacI family DNA-binding transcriptional regulator [Euzebyales bacterium]|nr:LacI family DNA-binding transcriptional regulator [Euzebyales bacterium]